MHDIDKLRHRLIDRQTVIDQAIDGWSFMVSGGHFFTFNIVQCFTVAPRCWSIRVRTLYEVSLKCWRR